MQTKMTVRKGYMSYLFTMSGTNVSLSSEELSLVANASWIRMKTAITGKVYGMFAASAGDIDRVFREKPVFETYVPQFTSPKISKGENYCGLPWVMLDYPRDFGKEDVFSLRTFFWWGNFFSISLHLSGRFRRIFLERRGGINAIPDEFWLCVHETPWQHYFESDNLVPIRSSDAEGALHESNREGFVKLVLKFDLDKWNQMPGLLRTGYEKIADLLV